MPFLPFCTATYSVQAEDTQDLVPFIPLIGLPAQFLGQPPRKVVDAVNDLRCRIRLARETAGKRVSRVAQRMTTIGFIGNKLADGDIVWNWGKLFRPCGSCEDHLEACEDVLAVGGNWGIALVIDQDRDIRKNRNREEQ